MNITDIFVRKLISSGRKSRIGSNAKTKSVKILLAIECKCAVPFEGKVKQLTSVEEPNIPKSLIAITSCRRLHP
jgi:hypothetical protein